MGGSKGCSPPPARYFVYKSLPRPPRPYNTAPKRKPQRKKCTKRGKNKGECPINHLPPLPPPQKRFGVGCGSDPAPSCGFGGGLGSDSSPQGVGLGWAVGSGGRPPMCGYGVGLGSDQPPCVGLGGGVWFLTNPRCGFGASVGSDSPPPKGGYGVGLGSDPLRRARRGCAVPAGCPWA